LKGERRVQLWHYLCVLCLNWKKITCGVNSRASDEILYVDYATEDDSSFADLNCLQLVGTQTCEMGVTPMPQPICSNHGKHNNYINHIISMDYGNNSNHCHSWNKRTIAMNCTAFGNVNIHECQFRMPMCK
jgi:hypothetical protein